MRVVRVLLTGPPCGGKSSVLEALRADLERRGHVVLCLGETATEVAGACSRMRDLTQNTACLYRFQAWVSRQQMLKERCLEDLLRDATCVLNEDQAVVCLFDRCLRDTALFCGPEVAAKVAQSLPASVDPDTFREAGLPPFDLVLHLQTVAALSPAAYETHTARTRTSRLHTVHEAAALEKAFADAYGGARGYVHIPASEHFDVKCAAVTAAFDTFTQLAR